MAEKFTKGGQEGWFHDPGYWGGFFHTYDHFQVGIIDDKPRQVHVFLPRDYEISQDSYPVIYMNDGDKAFFPGDKAKKSWNMAGILSRLYLSNQIGKVIVVGICPLNRDYEYTHAPVWGHDWGGLEAYSAYLAHHVKRFIDSNYRTQTDAEKTLILGADYGGLAAFYTASQYPEQFRCVAAFSPSFWVGLDGASDTSQGKQFNSFNAFFETPLSASTLIYAASPTLKNPQKCLKIYLDWNLARTGDFQHDYLEERTTARCRQMRDLLIKDFNYQEGKNLFIVEDSWEETWANRMENVLKIFFN